MVTCVNMEKASSGRKRPTLADSPATSFGLHYAKNGENDTTR